MAIATFAHSILRLVKWLVILAVLLAIALAVGGFFVVRALVEPDRDQFGMVTDEAKKADKSVEFFRLTYEGTPPAPYAAMDKGLLAEPPKGADGAPQWPPEILEVAELLKLPPEEVRERAIRGQNTWIAWTGGNDRFWDYAAQNQLAGGAFDLLKIVSSHPSSYYGRKNRWEWLGVVNRPCFTGAEKGDPAHFGLWLDQPATDTDCEADPLADAETYKGVEYLARGKPLGGGTGDCTRHTPVATTPDRSGWPEVLPVGSYYGEPTGVVGLRLFPNPDFDAAARDCWDPERFYTDPSYYNDKDLVRPYRIGMSCAFCHVGPNPMNPPKRPEHPEWAELTSNPGAQYYWVNRIFFWNTEARKDPAEPAPNENQLLYQLFHTNPPGSLDTSLVSTDYMNNPRTMNAVYNVIARQKLAATFGREHLGGDDRANKQFQNYDQTKALADFYDEGTFDVGSMRVLKDGADSVGTLGALNRVYLNIGLFSEEWLLHFRPFLGGQKISPIRIADAQKNSVYWQATEKQTADMAIFFLVTARPDTLEDALKTLPEPSRENFLKPFGSPEVERGKVVFAENCAACHSSKLPELPACIFDGACEGGGAGPGYRECWDKYWAWTKTDGFKSEMTALVKDDTFLKDNYLSHDQRVPLDLVGTNTCTAIATNGLGGDIWDNFTSETYKNLPPVKEVTVHHPVSGGAMPFQPDGAGRGYLRPPSLVSVWSTAPFLSNNSLGHEEYYFGKDGYRRYAAGNDYSAAVIEPPEDMATSEATLQAATSGEGSDTPAPGPVLAPEATVSVSPATTDASAATTDGAAATADGAAATGDSASATDDTATAAADTAPATEAAPVAEAASAARRPAARGNGGGERYGYGYGYGDGPTCPSADPDDPYLPCVENRLRVFETSIRQLLNPELRRKDELTEAPVPGYIARFSAPACYRLAPGYLPDTMRTVAEWLAPVVPWVLDEDGGIALGPLPAGFPANTLFNAEILPDNDDEGWWAHGMKLARAGPTLVSAFYKLGGMCSPEELADPATQRHAQEVVAETGLIDTLVGISKCPDYVVNKGHPFGTDLPDADKEALISYIKHF